MSEINLKDVVNITIDLSKFPGASILVFGSENRLLSKMEYSSHGKATEMFNDLNSAWYRVLKEKSNESRDKK